MKHIVVGDIHSNYKVLSNIIEKYSPSKYKYIFTGDYSDYRGKDPKKNSNYIITIQLILFIIENYNGIALLGNHDDKLRRWFNGRNVELREGLKETLDDISEHKKLHGDVFINRIHRFLNEAPLTHIEVINGITYKFAHAIYPEHNEIYRSESVAKNIKIWKEHCIWGYPRTLDDEKVFHRVHYWELDEYNQRVPKDTVKIAGHYHIVFQNEKFVILDGTPGIASYIIEDNLLEEW